MSRPVSLLEALCAHALSLGADSLEVEYEDRKDRVYARQGNTAISIAHFKPSSTDGKELRKNLGSAERKPVRLVVDGKLYILRVSAWESFGEYNFRVKIVPAPKPDASRPPRFTAKQGQYLAFIYHYTKIHRVAPAESDLQRYFQVSAPSIHEMIRTLERNGLIEKTPGEARSIRLGVAPEHLPPLE